MSDPPSLITTSGGVALAVPTLVGLSSHLPPPPPPRSLSDIALSQLTSDGDGSGGDNDDDDDDNDDNAEEDADEEVEGGGGGDPALRCVLTVPASFSGRRRAAAARCAEEAGFRVAQVSQRKGKRTGREIREIFNQV